MPSIDVPLTQAGFGQTLRKDAWWREPLLVFLGYATFIVYATWACLQGTNYLYTGGGADYLSPFYSPDIFTTAPSWWPTSLIAFSMGLIVLPFPGLFRFTCYYYRGAYYKAFWADPPSCTVGEPRKTYWGERTFPLILQNVHRYFLYVAIFLVFDLFYDGWRSLWFTGADGAKHFGLGVGSLVLIINPVLLGLYTFGCHSFRHLIGGRVDEVSKNSLRKSCYDCASGLNKHHMRWAWISMFFVGFADLYVRLVSMGVWTDFRFF